MASRFVNISSLRSSNLDVAFATAFGTLVSGAFLVGYVQKLGGGDFTVNLLSAIPSLAGILQIPGAIVGRGFPSFKPLVTPGGAAWRCLYIPVALLPLLMLGAPLKVTILTICVCMASLAGSFGNPVYNDWIAEMVPDGSRGAFFARRNAIAASVGAVVGILGATVLDAFRTNRQENAGFATVYGLGLICAVVSMFFYLRIGDVPRPSPVKQNLGEGLRAILKPYKDRSFRPVLLFLSVFIVAQAFPGNLYVAYARESLQLNYKIIQGTAVAMAIGNVLAASVWGFLSDRYGNRPVLYIVGLGLAFLPVPWILTIPGNDTFNAALLLTTHIAMGAVWAGVNLCQFNIVLATADPKDRGNYIASAMALISVVGGVAPLLGAAVMEQLRGHFAAPVAYKCIFGSAILLRFISLIFLRGVRERGSTEIKTTLRDLSKVSLRGVRTIRTLSRQPDIETRENALAVAGEEGLSLASDEVLKALYDPLPRIRRQAALSLATMREPRAVGALLKQVEEFPDLIEEETIDVLGALGDPAAVPILIHNLSSPRSLLRRAAARALGRIGMSLDAPEAAEALIIAARDPHDVDLRRAALQSLRVMRIDAATEVIAQSLNDPHPSVRIAAAEAVAEMKIAAGAEVARQSLSERRDEATPEVAYALGSVGKVFDLPALLHEAALAPNNISRRRILLGVASLLDVERDVYRLMMLEGMARDGALMEMLKPLLKRDRTVQHALEMYAAGDEAGAVSMVAALAPVLAPLTTIQVSEAFLIAAALISKSSAS